MKKHTEFIPIVDSNNIPMKMVKDRKEVHEEGLWHRVSHLWIYNDKKEVLLQKRSKKKKLFAGLWTASSGGHLDDGETYTQTVIREAREELGIKIDAKKLIELGIFRLPSVDKTNWLIDNEFTKAFALFLKEAKFKLDKEEVSEVKWLDIDRIRIMLLDKEESHAFADELKKNYVFKVLEKIEALSK